MLYELLLFFGLFNPENVKLEHSDADRLCVQVTESQFDHLLMLMKENPQRKEELDKYLKSIEVDTQNKDYKLMLRFKK